MAKRFIERPSARQIVDKAERDAAYERKRDLAADWLASNYAKPQPPPLPTKAELRLNEDHATFERFYNEHDHNETPDPLGKTGTYEPKSIYSPAPASRIRREPPAKRRAAERDERDCELPADGRRHLTLNVTNLKGKATGTITVNPFAKTFHVQGLRFRDGMSAAERRAKK
jgi:hypothetical protein